MTNKPTIADAMHAALTLLGEYGTPQIAPEEGFVVLYAETSDQVGRNGYRPVYRKAIPDNKINSVLSIAKKADFDLEYDPEHWDENMETTYSAFLVYRKIN